MQWVLYQVTRHEGTNKCQFLVRILNGMRFWVSLGYFFYTQTIAIAREGYRQVSWAPRHVFFTRHISNSQAPPHNPHSHHPTTPPGNYFHATTHKNRTTFTWCITAQIIEPSWSSNLNNVSIMAGFENIQKYRNILSKLFRNIRPFDCSRRDFWYSVHWVVFFQAAWPMPHLSIRLVHSADTGPLPGLVSLEKDEKATSFVDAVMYETKPL